MQRHCINCDCCDSTFIGPEAIPRRVAAKKAARAEGWAVDSEANCGRCPRCLKDDCKHPCGRPAINTAPSG